MATGRLTRVIEHLRGAAGKQLAAATGDGDLVRRYVKEGDATAFEALVRRHGPMVFGVCRRVLHHVQDAEDAFQATFLLLVRKAATLRSPARVGNWLYGVAYRTAWEARKATARRRAREATMLPRTPTHDTWDDLRPVLDLELERLPDRYRAVIVLCDLEGKTRKEAARTLGWAEGTVASRLARGRVLLAKRLARLGLTVSGGAVAAALPHRAAACLPTALISATLKAASALAARHTLAAGAIPGSVASLMEGVAKSMLLKKLKRITLILATVLAGVIGTTIGLRSHGNLQAQEPTSSPVVKEVARKDGATLGKIGAAHRDNKIQGTWTLQSVQRSGRRLPLEPGSVQLVVTNRFLIWEERGEDRAFLYRLNPEKSPKQIDLTSLVEGPEKGETIRGIYGIDGDELKICESDGARPTEFTARPGSGFELFTYRRVAALAPGKDSAKTTQPEPSLDPSWADRLFLGKGGTSHDFGTVAPGAQLRHRFVLKNIYKVPLEITGIRASCGCAMFAHTTKAISPGEEGGIDVTLDSRRFRGPKTVSIYVTVGPVFVSTAALRITANVSAKEVVSELEVQQADAQVAIARTRHFKIPFTLDASRRQNIRKIVLLSSRDRGATWTEEATETPEAKHFDISVPEGGLYWFAVRVLLGDGTAEPAEDEGLRPSSKVLVKTEEASPRR